VDSSRYKRKSPDSAAESGAVSTDLALADPDLVAIVTAWATLPETTRRAILNLVGDRSID